MEFRIIIERGEVDRLFGSLGPVIMEYFMRPQQRVAANPMEGAQIGRAQIGGGRRMGAARNLLDETGVAADNEPASMADFQSAVARVMEGQEVLPATNQDHAHRYAYLETQHGNDIYVCHQDGCNQRLAIPGSIVERSPSTEIMEVERHERERRERSEPDPPPPPPR